MTNTDLLNHTEVSRLIALALEEDGVANDLTTKASGISSKTHSRATIVAKSSTVAAGYPLIEKILLSANAAGIVKTSCLVNEGTRMSPKTPWIILEGSAETLLTLERTLLNFLIRMSGIATYTAAVVEKIKGTECKLLHTRKTAPGHRRTDVYAALVGGAHAHRLSLSDAILVKENHLRVTPSFQDLADGIAKLRAEAKFVEIEVTDFVELKHALGIKPDRIMLDNFSVADVEKAVNLFGASVQFEASGNINLMTAYEYAHTGVDFISMGALTHSAPAADLSMLFDFTHT